MNEPGTIFESGNDFAAFPTVFGESPKQSKNGPVVSAAATAANIPNKARIHMHLDYCTGWTADYADGAK